MTIRFVSVLLAVFIFSGCSKTPEIAAEPAVVANDSTSEPSSESSQPKAEFAVSASQLQALGIKLLKLDRPTEIRGLTYPARVVVPPQSEQMQLAPSRLRDVPNPLRPVRLFQDPGPLRQGTEQGDHGAP